jgi:hypothetical protein
MKQPFRINTNSPHRIGINYENNKREIDHQGARRHWIIPLEMLILFSKLSNINK